MLEHWMRDPMPAEELVFERMGFEVQNFVQQFRNDPAFTLLKNPFDLALFAAALDTPAENDRRNFGRIPRQPETRLGRG